MTPESDAKSHTSDESYKYPDDKLENNVPLNVECINEGDPDSELQRDHFQGRDDVNDEDNSNKDDNNDGDHVSIGSNNSILIQSANTTDNNALSNNEGDIDILDTEDDNADSITSKTSNQIPKELHTTLDSDFWLQVGLLIDDTRPDLAVNLDRFYRGDNNHIGDNASIVLSAIIQYSPIEPNYVLATMYQVESAVTESRKQHANKATPQYGFHKGMKEFADERREATKQELYENLLGMNAVTMIEPHELDKELCINALTYLMFLKRKRTGKAKARGCADGCPQHDFISSEEVSSPTVSIYALMTCCIISSIENRHVVTCNILGAFLQLYWPKDKTTYLRFDGTMVDMLCEIDSSLKDKIVRIKNGNKFMFGKLDKAVYGMLLGAILFYEKSAVQLYKWGYIMNPYDTCTFNKMVNGKHITVQFFVDDLHISCENMDTIVRLIKDLNQKFKTNFQELAVTKGKVHDYLGINIDYSNNEYVKFTMYNFLEDVLSEAQPDMNGRSK